jgi:hypothetical protein
MPQGITGALAKPEYPKISRKEKRERIYPQNVTGPGF